MRSHLPLQLHPSSVRPAPGNHHRHERMRPRNHGEHVPPGVELQQRTKQRWKTLASPTSQPIAPHIVHVPHGKCDEQKRGGSLQQTTYGGDGWSMLFLQLVGIQMQTDCDEKRHCSIANLEEDGGGAEDVDGSDEDGDGVVADWRLAIPRGNPVESSQSHTWMPSTRERGQSCTHPPPLPPAYRQ